MIEAAAIAFFLQVPIGVQGGEATDPRPPLSQDLTRKAIFSLYSRPALKSHPTPSDILCTPLQVPLRAIRV